MHSMETTSVAGFCSKDRALNYAKGRFKSDEDEARTHCAQTPLLTDIRSSCLNTTGARIDCCVQPSEPCVCTVALATGCWICCHC